MRIALALFIWLVGLSAFGQNSSYVGQPGGLPGADSLGMILPSGYIPFGDDSKLVDTSINFRFIKGPDSLLVDAEVFLSGLTFSDSRPDTVVSVLDGQLIKVPVDSVGGSGGDGLGTAFTTDRIILADGTTAGTTDPNLTWNGSQLIIGTSTPTVAAFTMAYSAAGTTYFNFYNDNFTSQETYLQIGNIINDYDLGTTAAGNFFIRDGANSPFQIEAGSADDALYINNAGNVGIGTDAPNTPLMISTNTTSVLGEIKIDQDGTGDAGMLLIAGSKVWNIGIDNSDSDKFKISDDAAGGDVGASTRLTIDASGKVGIGTSAPDRALHVVGSSGQVASFPSTGGADVLVVENNGNANISAISGTNGQFSFKAYENGVAGYRGILLYDHSAESWDFRTNGGGTDMFIDSGGNVGIGTGSPAGILDITSTTSALILPRMTTTQQNAISSPINGMIIYNTTTSKVTAYASGAWVALH